MNIFKQFASNARNDYDMMTNPARRNEFNRVGNDIGMKMITAGITMPNATPLRNSTQVAKSIGESQKVKTLLDIENKLPVVQKAVYKSKQAMNDYTKLNFIRDLLAKGKEKYSDVLTGRELLNFYK